MGWFAVCLGLLASVLSSAAQAPGPTLNVTVRDSRGRIVRGLEAPDFSVTEDGAAAGVRSARFIETAKDPIHVTLVFDRMRGEPARLSKDAALELLAAGANLEFAVWLVDQKLSILAAPTADRKAVKLAVDAATGKNPPNPASASSATIQAALRASAQLLRESRYRPSIASLIAIARAHQDQSGRKAIVYFCDGLPLAAGDESLLTAISAANRAGISIYVVDASGLAISKEEDSARHIAVNYRLATSHQTLNQEDQQGIYQNSGTGDRGLAVGNLANAPIAQPSPIAQLAGKTGAFVISHGGDFRRPVRRLAEELAAYYEVTYSRPTDVLDGRFHEVRVAVSRDKTKVQSAAGFYAAVEGSGGASLAFETLLFELLPKAPVRDFPVAVETVQFRGREPARPLVSLLIEVAARQLQFDEDAAASLFRGHLSILAVVRDAAGAIVDRFGRDMPLQSPRRMLEDMRARRLLFQEQFHLAPGSYTVETAVQDRLSGRVSVLKSPFDVTASAASPAASPAIEGLNLVRHVLAAADATPDGAFSLPAKNVVPTLDRVLQGGKGAFATFFFRLYPAAPTPVLAFELVQNGKVLIHKPLQPAPADADREAQVISLDISTLPSGPYDVRIIATSEGRTAAAGTRITIANGAVPESGPAAATEEPEVAVAPAATVPSFTPTAGQQRLIEEARVAGLQYAEHLPNFVCTEVTRRLLDPAGKQEWRNLDEGAQLVSYYDGKEHYENLTARNRAADSDRYPPSLNTTGEFGSLLKSIFAPESAARFSWVRADSLRGTPVEVFSYAVDAQHSQYRVSHQVAGQPKAVFSAFHGLLFIDRETAVVLRLTLESDALPADFPVRQMSVSLDYGDTEVGGQVYILPLSFTVDVRLRKRTLIRNESVFRSYQRFTSESRIVPAGR